MVFELGGDAFATEELPLVYEPFVSGLWKSPFDILPRGDLGLGEVGPLPVRRFGNEALGLGERWPLEDGGAARVRLAEAVEEGVFCRLNCEELRTVRLSSSRPMSSKLPISSIAEVSS